MHRRAHRRVVSWIALLAILMASLAPALSHAMGSAPAATWTEICTSSGSVLVAVAHEDAGTPASRLPGDAHALEHCPYCSLHVDAFAMPPALPTVHEPLLLGDIVPAALPHAEAGTSAWPGAQPRAPPVRR
jgi:hypothetical protein